MKTLSELSGTVIRMAAAAIAEAKRSLPADEPPAAPVPADAAPEGTAAPEAAAGAEVPGDAAPAASPDAPAEAAPAAAAAPSRPEDAPESDAVKAVLDEAVAKATGFSGDRLAMLRAAVEIAKPRLRDVRLVRVFGVEEKLTGGQIVGQYQYVVDLFPAAMKQVPSSPKDERRGGRRGGGGGGGDRGAKGSATGGFSMDSLRDDRKKEGGGRGRPGGPRGAGGGAARPPGGSPKK